jgi:hypothetical protein
LDAPLTDWNKAAERIVAGIIKALPTYNGLIFVEGIGSGQSSTTHSPTSDSFQKVCILLLLI